MFKYFILLFSITLHLWSCPFDEAKIEVTIVAHKNIYNAVLKEDFEKASQEISKNRALYLYFEEVAQKPLYQELINATKEKNVVQIKSILDYTLALEIEELLQQVDENFHAYQKSRLLLIKAKKHLQALTKDKEAMNCMNNILHSIGNPGLMGVGKKDPNRETFEKNRTKLLTYLRGLQINFHKA